MVESNTEKSNSKIEQNLERLYKTTLDQEQLLAFFKGLGEYLKYVFKTPVLKEIFDKQIAERNIRYETIKKIEQKAEKEMRNALKEILSIIKDISIDTKSFERFTVFFNPIAGFPVNIMEELEAFEKQDFTRSGYASTNLERYLYDISANLLKMGYEKELKNFLVSEEECAKYYWRINGDRTFIKNGYGSFIFSKTWPERFEQERLLDKERKLKTWGEFEILLDFNLAYDAIVEDKSFDELLREEKGLTLLQAKNRVDTAFMAEDLKSLLGQNSFNISERFNSGHSLKLNNLDVSTFKTTLRIAHNHLVQNIEFITVEEPIKLNNGKKRKDIFIENDFLYFDTKKIPIERGQKSMVEFLLKNAKIFRGSKITQKGTELKLIDIKEFGGYQNESAFRNALNKLRKKLKNADFPVSIENPQTGKYQMVIKYK